MSSSWEQQQLEMYTPVPELASRELEGMNDEEFWSYVVQRAQHVPDAPAHADYIECQLDDKMYLLSLRDLVEVLAPPYRLARLPAMPCWMLGLLAWRGETIAVINLAQYLFPSGAPARSQAAHGPLLIVAAPHATCGLLVPALGQTTVVESERIFALPTTAYPFFAGHTERIEGVYEGMALLNVPALLADLVQQIGVAHADE